jgi:RNA polymerase sigma-70 factor (ECF subfamily)
MAERQRHPEPGELVAHAAFVRHLARSLLSDADAADDVAQDALLAVWQRSSPPRDVRGLLATVARRLAWRHARSARRRRARETAAAGAEPQAPADVAAQSETLRRVADAVAGLTGRSREVVMLRHYADLTPAQISEHLGVPVDAVRSRLRRAHAELRESLGRRDGAWRGALVALVLPHLGTKPAALAGAGAVLGIKLKVGLGVAVAALAGLLLWRPAPHPAAPASSADPAPSPASASSEASGDGSAPAARSQVATADAGPGAGRARLEVRGRVVDPRRRPVAAARVTAECERRTLAAATSAADGTFALLLAAADERRWGGVVAVDAGGGSGAAPLTLGAGEHGVRDVGAVVIEGDRTLAVRVTEAGNPVPFALVVARAGLFGWDVHRIEARTGAAGVAHFRGLAPVTHRVDAETPAGRRAGGRVDPSTTGELALDIAAAGRLEVRVVDRALRTPVAGALVASVEIVAGEGGGEGRVGRDAFAPAITDERGEAVITGLFAAEVVEVAVAADGYPAAQQPRLRASAADGRVEVALVRAEPRAVRWVITPGEVAAPGPDSAVRAIALPRSGSASLPDLRVEPGHLVADDVPPDVAPTFLAEAADGAVAAVTVPIGGDRGEAVTFVRPRRAVVRVRDGSARGLRDWPVVLRAGPVVLGPLATDADGRAEFGPLPGGRFTAWLDDAPYSATPDDQAVGELDLGSGDAALDVVRDAPIEIVAQVRVDGEARLPSRLQLAAENGRCTGLVEDPERGRLTFALWPHDRARASAIVLYGPWDHSTARAEVPAGAAGTFGAELALERRARAVVRVATPADGSYRLVLERQHGESWAIWTHQPETRARGVVERAFTNLRPGLYRARDGDSGVVGSVVDVTAGTPAVLDLDLRDVVAIAGTVVAGSGRPVVGAEVVGDGDVLARTGDDGRFRFRAALSRPLELTLRHRDLAPHPQLGSSTVSGPTDALRLEMVER